MTRSWFPWDRAPHAGSVHQVSRISVPGPDGVSQVLGAKNREQLLDNIAATQVKLSAEDLSALNAVSALPPEYPDGCSSDRAQTG